MLSLAPLLCDLFLSEMDIILDNCFENTHVIKVFRYGDDFLILLDEKYSSTDIDEITTVLSLFKLHGNGLSFTHEIPAKNALQFLDLNLKFLKQHVCWSYSPRAKKELLPYDSATRKLLNEGSQ